MSSVEDRNLNKSSMIGFALNEKDEMKIQEEIDILIDYMAVASIAWSYGNPDVALELAACARVALDNLLELRGIKESPGPDNNEGRNWDFIKLLGSLGGEALGEVIYWSLASKNAEIPREARELLEEFAKFVGLKLERSSSELGEKVLLYISKTLNRTIASLVVSTRRSQ